MKRPLIEVPGMLLPVLRHATGEIRTPDEVREGDYDLVCIGSPTWWLSPSVPIRSFLESDEAGRLLDGTRFAVFTTSRRYWKHNVKSVRKLGAKQGGVHVDDIHFTYEGGQVRSLLSLLSYLGKGENRERYVGVKIPPTNLRPHHLEEAKAFAGTLADRLD